MKVIIGCVYTGKGNPITFAPSLEKGDRETRLFAETSNNHVKANGLSMLFQEPTKESIDSAISYLNKLKEGIE